jgi:hypothetical protein
MNNKLKAALIGGAIVGVLSVIVSQIPVVSLCCCLWGIAGGVVAGMIYIKGSPTRVSPGEGALVGALAGLVGAVIYLIIGLPIALFIGAAAIQDAMSRSGVNIPIGGVALLVIGNLVGGVCLIVLATLGGLLAIPIFEKRKGDTTPPPPPGSGPVGGSYAA